MKKMKGKNSVRNIPVLSAVVLAGLLLCSCGDAGGGAGTPTGPDSRYNPEIDAPRAGVTAQVSPSAVGTNRRGAPPTFSGVVTLTAYFRDANGNPVEGVAVLFGTESITYFSFDPNPSYTDKNGGASTRVNVTAAPPGTYIFAAFTSTGFYGPSAIGYTYFRITFSGLPAP